MKRQIKMLAIMLALSTAVHAQSKPEPSPVIVTTFYIDFQSMMADTTFNVDSLLTYYIDKGVKPNPMIKNFRILAHWWGADNSKVLVIYELDKLENLNKAQDKTDDLINATFKSKDDQKLFWKRWGKIFNRHEDSIMTDVVKGKM